jgi:hypothetical protein
LLVRKLFFYEGAVHKSFKKELKMFEFSWETLQQNLQKDALPGEKKDFKDSRFWKLSKDESGTGAAVIRLLPDSAGPDAKPFVKIFHHSIKFTRNGKDFYYIQDSPETIGLPCPASEKWQELWNSGNQEKAKLYSRKIKYIANILVVKDPGCPENNGKVFLWEFGTKLMDKFIAAMNPTEAMREVGVKPKQLFDPTANGSSISLQIKKANNFFNYDDTTILDASAVFKSTEAAVEFINKNCYKLDEFISPAHFKPYNELKALLTFAETGQKTVKGAEIKNNDVPFDEDEKPKEIGVKKQATIEKPTKKKVEEAPETKSVNDDLDFLDDLIG